MTLHLLLDHMHTHACAYMLSPAAADAFDELVRHRRTSEQTAAALTRQRQHVHQQQLALPPHQAEALREQAAANDADALAAARDDDAAFARAYTTLLSSTVAPSPSTLKRVRSYHDRLSALRDQVDAYGDVLRRHQVGSTTMTFMFSFVFLRSGASALELHTLH
jgi:hypothetical protein